MALDPDFMLAKVLQEQFNKEAKNAEKTKNNNRKHPSLEAKATTYDCSPAKKMKSTSLIDPEWEVIDPTPDVHSLFLAFNMRFFWGKLESVEVRWSPRMYSCAGVCVYEGRRGMCSVRLSEPLLKLRPRSDMIETLLHEMIHAYLFVTHNNRDRDGHGPEFHKHMYRINKDAGTNISVYHSFHDEVKLYQTHWWRCDGPCQSRPPFFGTVKRSMNRAPGPNDFWWGEHMASCGGEFIKVKEPETIKKKKSSPPKSSPSKFGNSSKPLGKDIRSYFDSPTKKNGSSSTTNNIVKPVLPQIKTLDDMRTTTNIGNKPSKGSSLITGNTLGDRSKNNFNGNTDVYSSGKINSGQNVFSIGDFKNDNSLTGSKPNSSINSGIFPNVNPLDRVHGFGNFQNKPSSANKTKGFEGPDKKLGTGNPSSTSGRSRGTGSFGGALMNRGSGTFVLTGKGGQKTEVKQETKTETFVPFKGQGQKLGQGSGAPVSCLLQSTPSTSNSTSSTNSSSRNNSTPSSRNCSSSSTTSSSNCNNTSSSSSSINNNNGVMSSDNTNALKDNFNDSAITISDNELAEIDLLEFNDVYSIDGDDDVNCPVCNRSINRDDMTIHLQSCDVLNATLQSMNNSSTFDLSDEESDTKEKQSVLDSSSSHKNDAPIDSLFPCPCCSKSVPESQINKHLDECLSMITLEEFKEEF